uniref:Uncharacterized protein n=1 Tax=Meloidogyne incognita TaxID=6306 RepID=A0A914LBA3_MELIC
MGLSLINIFTLFLILGIKFGHSLKCHVEIDFTHKNGTRVVEKPDTCNTKIPLYRLFGDNCVKNDCGKYGFWKFCADCDFFELGNMVNGMGDDCTCYQCNTDYCNSAFGVVSNIKIIALLCWIILILSFI